MTMNFTRLLQATVIVSAYTDTTYMGKKVRVSLEKLARGGVHTDRSARPGAGLVALA